MALEENVLDLVALIAQHISSVSTFKADCPVVLELLHGIYRQLSPKDVFGADEELLLGGGSAGMCACTQYM